VVRLPVHADEAVSVENRAGRELYQRLQRTAIERDVGEKFPVEQQRPARRESMTVAAETSTVCGDAGGLPA